MPKGRIGLSLDEDVLAILNEYGHCQYRPSQVDRAHFDSGKPTPCKTCGREVMDVAHSGDLPQRYEIIQTAVREWATRQRTPASPDVQTDSKTAKPKQVKGEKRNAAADPKDIENLPGAHGVFPETASTYCPRHRPKPCAADCEFRVNV